jgi:hypothetical protein
MGSKEPNVQLAQGVFSISLTAGSKNGIQEGESNADT